MAEVDPATINPQHAVSHSRVQVDLDAIEWNLQQIRSSLPEGVAVLGVVKADAYGHGAVEVGRKLTQCGIDYLGVSDLQEALKLRGGGIEGPLLLMQGCSPDEAALVVRHRLSPVVYDLSVLSALARVPKPKEVTVPVHLKFDTGMGRLGFDSTDLEAAVEAANKPGLALAGVLSHLSLGEEPDHPITTGQLKAFRRICQRVREFGLEPLFHCENSAAALSKTRRGFGMVRIGLSLYGVHPVADLAKPLSLKPAMRWSSKLLHVRTVPAGCGISYEATHVTRAETRIGVIALGYSAGLPWGASGRGAVLVNGVRCSILGRVCMDLTIVDLSDVEAVAGDEVILMGRQGACQIGTEEVASWGRTLSYDVLCSVGLRGQRDYSTTREVEGGSP